VRELVTNDMKPALDVAAWRRGGVAEGLGVTLPKLDHSHARTIFCCSDGAAGGAGMEEEAGRNPVVPVV